MKEFIRNNPKLSKLFTSDGIVLFGLLAGGILTQFGEILPAVVASTLGFIVKIYNIYIGLNIIKGREEIIVEETGKTVNEYLENEEGA
ncbi:hypothetical protein [Methanobrevibacter cuticularis]|nr:hypothetical protein [Methanobrevibacter cuticularis]